MTKDYYDPLSRLLHWLMAAVILYATLAGYLMHLVIDSHPRLFQFLSVLNMSMAALITPLFLLRWGWPHWRCRRWHRRRWACCHRRCHGRPGRWGQG